MTQAGENQAALGLQHLGGNAWRMDGVPTPLPGELVARLTWAGDLAKPDEIDHAWRDATWGPLVAVIVWPFADGKHTVAVCQKGMLVYLAENKAPYNVQGVLPAEQRKIWEALHL